MPTTGRRLHGSTIVKVLSCLLNGQATPFVSQLEAAYDLRSHLESLLRMTGRGIADSNAPVVARAGKAAAVRAMCQREEPVLSAPEHAAPGMETLPLGMPRLPAAEESAATSQSRPTQTLPALYQIATSSYVVPRCRPSESPSCILNAQARFCTRLVYPDLRFDHA
jgi:hypothetical protein